MEAMMKSGLAEPTNTSDYFLFADNLDRSERVDFNTDLANA